MKRSIDSRLVPLLLNDDGEPNTKVILVERDQQPLGVSLVSPVAIAKKSYSDAMDLSTGSSQVNSAIRANARNKLDIIGSQMKNLQDLMMDVLEDTQLSLDLHSVACNFVKKPGHVYHLYERPSGQRYLGMLSPEDWQTSPHNYLGSFMLEADSSWTSATLHNGRYQGVNFLKEMFRLPSLA